MKETGLSESVAEPLHDELDLRGVPFRNTQGELLEQYDDGSDGRRVKLPLPMTVGFVETQVGPLSIRLKRDRDLDRRCPGLDGAAADYAAVVADLTKRFGEPQVVPADHRPERVRWATGALSEIIVTPDSLEGPHVAGCTLFVSHNYVRPFTGRETLALDHFHLLHEQGSNSFGWTEVDGTKLLMQFLGRSHVRLTDPSEIGQLEVTEYEKARSDAFSTIAIVLADGDRQSLASDGLGAFTSIAEQLVSELGVELKTAWAKST